MLTTVDCFLPQATTIYIGSLELAINWFIVGFMDWGVPCEEKLLQLGMVECLVGKKGGGWKNGTWGAVGGRLPCGIEVDGREFSIRREGSMGHGWRRWGQGVTRSKKGCRSERGDCRGFPILHAEKSMLVAIANPIERKGTNILLLPFQEGSWLKKK